MFDFFKKKINSLRNYLFTPFANYNNKHYLNNPIVYQCIELIGNSAIKIEIEEYAEKEKWVKFIHKAITRLEIDGNLFVVNKDYLEILTQKEELEKFNFKDILHIKKMTFDEDLGISPISTLKKYINCQESILDYLTAISQNGGRLSGILSHDTIISDGEKVQISQQLKELNTNCVLLVDGHYKWQSIGLSPKDLDILNMSKHIERVIATTLGVPPILLGIQDATFSNYQQAFNHLEQFKVIPTVNFIINQINHFFQLNIKIKKL